MHAAQLIEHFALADVTRFLAKAARVLRPNGILYLSTPGVHNVWNSFSQVRSYPPAAFANMFSRATENYLRQKALAELEVECVFGNCYYFSSRALNFASSILDLLIPPRDLVGWVVVPRKKDYS